MYYDDAYKKTPGYFGDQPAELLTANAKLISRKRPVLDVGAGQGRNTLYLARRGHHVDAIDPAEVGIAEIARLAAMEDLPVTYGVCGFEDFTPPQLPYGAVLLFGIIQILSRPAIDKLMTRIREWTATGSEDLANYVFVSAFSVDEPAAVQKLKDWRPVGKNSYLTKDGQYRTLLEPEEILTLFSGFDVVSHHEGMGPEHAHGSSPPHRHGLIEAVFRR